MLKPSTWCAIDIPMWRRLQITLDERSQLRVGKYGNLMGLRKNENKRSQIFV